MTDTPFTLFDAWFAEAEAGEPNDPNAMTLATADASGRPSARIVLLKGHGAEIGPGGGFVFYTNSQSRKGGELEDNPYAALLFHWKSLGRQIRIEGKVEQVSDAYADRYFATRPRISQLGAWASEQSRVLPDRQALEARLAEAEARYDGEDVPRPPHWWGYCLTPKRFEFWQAGDYRLHQRHVYEPDGAGGWSTTLLSP